MDTKDNKPLYPYEESSYTTTTEHAGHAVSFAHNVREYANAMVGEDGTIFLDYMHADTDDSADHELPVLYCNDCDEEVSLPEPRAVKAGEKMQ